jgi:hypothetical protein
VVFVAERASAFDWIRPFLFRFAGGGSGGLFSGIGVILAVQRLCWHNALPTMRQRTYPHDHRAKLQERANERNYARLLCVGLVGSAMRPAVVHFRTWRGSGLARNKGTTSAVIE